MSTSAYDYENRAGVLPISWEDVHGLCRALARSIARYDPAIVLAIGRGGFYPGTLISHILQREIYPIRLTRRQDDVVVRDRPAWLVPPPALVAGHRVLIVDEIVSTGETVQLARERALELGAAEVRVAVLYAHRWGTQAADYIGLISDALIVNPWDREVFTAGEYRPHPEYVDALAKQGLPPDPILRVPASKFALAKG
jgi:hypothetical protein